MHYISHNPQVCKDFPRPSAYKLHDFRLNCGLMTMVMPSNEGFTYRVVTEQDPGALSRVLEFFALNNHVPECLTANRRGEDEMEVEVTVPDLEYTRARVIAAKIGQLVPVRHVRLFATRRKAMVGASGGLMEFTEVLV